ncbi:hypothetical protein O0L34_g15831 [Tuta absoluta]|nr:hypothetical protein O0L34_g15831 [Tuta absoluta]
MNAPLDVDGEAEVETNIPAPAPLRQPREPAQRDDDSGSDRGVAKKFSVPKSAPAAHRNAGTRAFNKPNQGDRVYRQPDNADRPNKQFDNGERPNKSFDNGERPNKSFDNGERPNRNSDNGDRPKFDKFNNRQSQDGGRPPLRKPQAVQDGERPGQKPNARRPQNKEQYNNTYDDDEDWERPSYRDRQQNQQNRPEQQSNGSWLDKKRQINRLQSNNDLENWVWIGNENGAANPEPKIAPAKEEPKPAPVNQTPLVQANRAQPSPGSANQREAPAASQNAAKPPAANQNAAPAVRPPASAADSTPARKLIPKNCLIELLSKGDEVVLSVDRPASEGHTDSTGFLCTTLNEKYEADYAALCDDYGVACEAEAPYTPAIGETFSYLDPTDGGWYRARCLTPAHGALLDASKVVPLAGARTVRLPAAFERQPEFTTLLQATVKVSDSLRCTLVNKTGNGWCVELKNAESGARVGDGEVSRWLPAVEHPAPVRASAPAGPAAPAPAAAASAPAIPEVCRPEVRNNSAVLMVHVTDASNIYVSPAGAAGKRAFDAALHDVAVHGLDAKPLTEPPIAGSYVISKYTDGCHYRALVKRTSVKQNKYLLEYIEYGNSHINQLENLYPLPDNLHPDTIAPMTSRVALAMSSQQPLTPAAEEYLDKLKDDNVELLLTIPNGAKTAPNGSEVTLTVASRNENVNKRVQEMCTPEWAQLQQRGGDVVEVEHLMYENVEFLPLPTPPCKLVVTDVGALIGGTLSVAPDTPHMYHKLDNITHRGKIARTLPTPPCKLLVTDVGALIGGTLSVAPDTPHMYHKLDNITHRGKIARTLPTPPCKLLVTDVGALIGGTLSVAPDTPHMYHKLDNITHRGKIARTLPTPPCKLLVTDVGALIGGTLSVAPDTPHMYHKLDNITHRMAKYCESELGREPYLPKIEELCIAQMPPYPQWFRAVFADHKVGQPEASVCYIDYGNMESVPVTLVRKMLPEFMRDLPAIATTVEIKDFPQAPTAEMIERAVQYLNLDEEGRGSLTVTACRKDGPGLYTVEAPQLLKAMRGGE